MSFFSIRTKLVFFFAILAGANSLFFLLNTTTRIEKQVFNAIHEKVSNISNITAFSIAPSLVYRDVPSAEELVKCLMEDKDIAYVVVLDENGDRFVSVNDSLDNAVLAGSTNRNLHRIFTPVIYRGRVIGDLHMGVSLERVRTEIENNAHNIFIFSVILFFIGLAAVIAISIPLTSPLKNISNVANAIASGDFNARAKVSSRDEIGEMATTFNHMLDSLDNAYKTMKSGE